MLFLDIAMPEKMTRNQILQRYDDNYGLPTDEMVLDMKQACEKIENMKTYDDWFKVNGNVPDIFVKKVQFE